MKKLLTVKSCCCGHLNLQSGSKCIAVLGMVFGIVASFASLYVLLGERYGNARLLERLYYIFRWISATGNLATAITSAIMFYGANTGRSAYLLPWLIMQGVSIVLMTVTVHAYAISLGFFLGFYILPPLAAIEALLVLWVHFFAVVFSLHGRLKELEHETPAQQNQLLDESHTDAAVKVTSETDLEKV